MKSALMLIFISSLLFACTKNTTTPEDSKMIITDEENNDKNIPAGLYSDLTTLGEPLEKRLQVGDFMLDFVVNKGTEQEFSFTDLRGKVVYINFWRTGCHFCIDEMPDLVNNFNQIADEDFVVLTVSLDKYFNVNFDKVYDFVKNFQMEKFVNLYDGNTVSSSLSKQLRINGTPIGYLVSKDGKIVSGTRANNSNFIQLVNTELAK